MQSSGKIEVEDIDHLGIIAGVIDEIGIVGIIDRELGIHSQEKVSAGQVVKAMILNCMGFLTSPLYLFSEFFAGKATEHLIGSGVKAEYLNESRLERVMDQLYEYGITLMFVKISTEMSKRFGVSTNQAHLDGTSIAVHGKYETKKEREEEESIVENESVESIAVTITQGYSRDHRPDLKQFTWHLLTIVMNVGNGNKSDQSAFPEVIKAFRREWEGAQPDLYVMDAAFYSEANLQEFGSSIEWISRVPATLKSAQELIKSLLPEQFSEQYDKKAIVFVLSAILTANSDQLCHS